MTQKTVVIPTMGSRGDVQPYIFLAKALKKADVHAVIATHPCWRQLIESNDIQFAPIGPDIDIEYESAVIRGKSTNWIIGAIRTMKFVFKIVENSSDEISELCRQADLVIASHSYIGAIEAEACGVPYVNVTLQTDMIPKKLDPKAKSKVISDKLIGALLNPLMSRPYNKIRKRLKLKKIKSMDQILSPSLNLIPISSFVIEQNPYWENKNKVIGYWFDDDDEYLPSDELLRFLNSGSKPVIIALGAMAFESKEEKNKLDIFVNAITKTGMRAIIQGFDQTLKDYTLPENIMHVGSIPHSWLFSQGSFIIHHGGFGTSASALLSGKPSIVIPHVLDQFLWANRIYELKAGMKPIAAKNLNEQILIDTIESLKNDYDQIRKNVELLSQKMKNEDGLGKATDLILKALDNTQSKVG